MNYLKEKVRTYFKERYDINLDMDDTARVFKLVSQELCGVNAPLCLEPFELPFLDNVSHNSNASMALILWLQRLATLNGVVNSKGVRTIMGYINHLNS